MRERIISVTQLAGLYVSIPFCKAKCTYCNFASGAFGAERLDAYVDKLCAEIGDARRMATELRADLPDAADSVYLGGGTPSLLEPAQVRRLFSALRAEFDMSPDAEITLECAPGQLTGETLEAMLTAGVNRVSLGVQSFVDAEARAVGRFHTGLICLREVERLRIAGVSSLNVDLIVGLPGQTEVSWRKSVRTAIESGVPHVSVYMLEVDEDSRLGRELLATGSRYGAAAVPAEDAIAEWYLAAREWLSDAGIHQYEISNFAREGRRSRHNMKYWRRQPYIGFGLDAHSMLRSGPDVTRFANPDQFDEYLAGSGEGSGAKLLRMLTSKREISRIGCEQQFEEALFLGLRMNDGVSLAELCAEFGGLIEQLQQPLVDVIEAGLLMHDGDRIWLTARGQIASNEVFSRLLAVTA